MVRSAKNITGLVVLALLSALGVIMPTANAAGGGPIGKQFVIADDSLTEIEPSLAYNTDRGEYLAVWYNNRTGNDDIQAQRVSKQGDLLGEPFYISAGIGADRRHPDVAYNPVTADYLVVWEHETSTHTTEIRGRRVSGTGQIIDTNDIVIARVTNAGIYQPAIDYAVTSQKYLVIWRESSAATMTSNIAAQPVANDATLDGSKFYITNVPTYDSALDPDLAYNRARNEFLVVWEYNFSAFYYDIYAVRVKISGTPGVNGANFAIAQFSGNTEIAPAVAAIPRPAGDGRYLVTYQMEIGSVQFIAEQLVAGTPGGGDSGGELIGSYEIISDNTLNDAVKPAVAGSETEERFAAVWAETAYNGSIYTGIVGKHISLAGVSGSMKESGGGIDADCPAIVSGGGGAFLVAFNDQAPLVTPEDIYGQLWGYQIFLPLILK